MRDRIAREQVMHFDPKEVRAEAMSEIARLLREDLALQAYGVVKSRNLGEPHEWSDADEMVLGGRVLTPLGASRRSDVVHYKAFRHHPQHARALIPFETACDPVGTRCKPHTGHILAGDDFD